VLLVGCEVERSHEGRSISAWQGDLKSPDYMVRWRALIVLTRIHDKDPEVLRQMLPDIIGLLQDDQYLVRRQAAMAVVKLGPDAKAALPQVLKLLRDPDPETRDWAGKAAKAIDEQAAAEAGVR
jgi:HEAT repeat protein